MSCCKTKKEIMKVHRISSTAKLPSKADGDMCYDIYANEDAVVEYGQIATIKTGIKIALPEGYHYSIRDRSGLAVKNGLHVLAGQIDNSYRGEIIICMTKLVRSLVYDSNLQIMALEKHYIKAGDKIAQFKIERDETFEILEVEDENLLGSTNRGEKGFGSSGNV